jgi:hypothetical protein
MRQPEDDMLRKTFIALIVCGLIAFAMNPLFAQQNASSLVGSWEFSLTPKSASSADRPIPGLGDFQQRR